MLAIAIRQMFFEFTSLKACLSIDKSAEFQHSPVNIVNTTVICYAIIALNVIVIIEKPIIIEVAFVENCSCSNKLYFLLPFLYQENAEKITGATSS